MTDKELLDLIRKNSAASIAQEIVSVQPISGTAFTDLYKASKNEEDLRKEGYEPISQDTHIMWIKKDNQ